MTERLQRFRALAHKEFLATVKEKTSRMILIGPLVLYIILFGYIASFNLDRVPYALCDLSNSALSTQFIQAIDNNRILKGLEHITVLPKFHMRLMRPMHF